MNLVLDDAEEVYVEKAGKDVKPRQDLGQSSSRILELSLAGPCCVAWMLPVMDVVGGGPDLNAEGLGNGRAIIG